MRPLTLIGAILVALGILALVYQGISYTKRDTIVDIGPIHATAEHEKTIPLPPVLGAIAIVGGVALMVAGAKQAG
jgi:hypothetical protein